MYIIIERDELIRQYKGYTQLEIVVSLNSLKHHGINVSGRTLQRILCRIGLHRRKNPSELRLVRNFVEAQLQKSGAFYGYHFMHCKLLQAGCIVSREIVRGLPHELEPEGVQLHKKRRLVRQTDRQTDRYFIDRNKSHYRLICHSNKRDICTCIGLYKNVSLLKSYKTIYMV